VVVVVDEDSVPPPPPHAASPATSAQLASAKARVLFLIVIRLTVSFLDKIIMNLRQLFVVTQRQKY
jgi:hypothetical protein